LFYGFHLLFLAVNVPARFRRTALLGDPWQIGFLMVAAVASLVAGPVRVFLQGLASYPQRQPAETMPGRCGNLRSPHRGVVLCCIPAARGSVGTGSVACTRGKSSVDWSATQEWLAGIARLASLLDVVVPHPGPASVDGPRSNWPRTAARRGSCADSSTAPATHAASDREHDFRRIPQRPPTTAVWLPLRHAPAIVARILEPALPDLAGVTCPGPSAGLAARATLSPALLASHRTVFWTALGLIAVARPAARPLTGKLLFVGGDPRQARAGPGRAGSYPHGCAPARYTPPTPMTSATPLTRLAHAAPNCRWTCVCGNHPSS